jgi:hypothetical protein
MNVHVVFQYEQNDIHVFLSKTNRAAYEAFYNAQALLQEDKQCMRFSGVCFYARVNDCPFVRERFTLPPLPSTLPPQSFQAV